MNITIEPVDINHEWIKVECSLCHGRKTTDNLVTHQKEECFLCDGAGFKVVSLQVAIESIMRQNFYDMLKASI